MDSKPRHGFRPNTGSVSFYAVLVLALGFLSVGFGMRYGVRWGYGWNGVPGAILGAAGGVVAGVAFALASAFFAALVSWPFEAFGRWWRPYPAPCGNDACSNGQYHCEKLQGGILKRHPHLSPVGWRCGCGDLYAARRDNRWVQLLPDGSIRPCRIHSAFGRWRRDDAAELPPVVEWSLETVTATLGIAGLGAGFAVLFAAFRFRIVPLAVLGIALTVTGGLALILPWLERRRKRGQSK